MNINQDARRCRQEFVQATGRLAPAMFPGFDRVGPVGTPNIEPFAYMVSSLEIAASIYDALLTVYDYTSRELPYCVSQLERDALLGDALPKVRQFAGDILAALQPAAEPTKSIGQSMRESLRPSAPLTPWQEITQIAMGAKVLMETLRKIVRACPGSPLS
ncbi:MAG TPA: hypothetical protein VF818_00070 [Ktedonobacterales bacterium]